MFYREHFQWQFKSVTPSAVQNVDDAHKCVNGKVNSKCTASLLLLFLMI